MMEWWFHRDIRIVCRFIIWSTQTHGERSEKMLRKSSNACMNSGNFSTQSRAHITQQSCDQNEEKQAKRATTTARWTDSDAQNASRDYCSFRVNRKTRVAHFIFFLKCVCSVFVFVVTVRSRARAPPNLTKSMFSSFSLSPFCLSFGAVVDVVFFAISSLHTINFKLLIYSNESRKQNCCIPHLFWLFNWMSWMIFLRFIFFLQIIYFLCYFHAPPASLFRWERKIRINGRFCSN